MPDRTTPHPDQVLAQPGPETPARQPVLIDASLLLERMEELKNRFDQDLVILLNQVKEQGPGTPPGELTIPIRQLTVGDLFGLLEFDYTANGRSSLTQVRYAWKRHIEPAFGALPAVSVSFDHINNYIASRQAAGLSPAYINRHLAYLQRIFKLAKIAGKVRECPHFPKLRERNVRRGFLRETQYEALARESERVGPWLRGMVEVAYTFGWRKGELLNLRCRQVDLAEGTITLDSGSTKNGDGRTVRMTSKVSELLEKCVAGKDPDEFVFTRAGRVGGLYRTHGSRFWWLLWWDGSKQLRRSSRTEDRALAEEKLCEILGPSGRPRPITDFRDDWKRACTAAGVPDLLFHDLRRTAARRMIRSGIDQKTAMMMTGHRTPSMFSRYQIVDEKDLCSATEKLEEAAAQRNAKLGTRKTA
ncbi:MAG: tyrosine-type recombinase/integrase [Terriglobales bacterium]